jgi:class 3 adenylate cyclase
MRIKKKAYYLIGLFCFITSSVLGQDQKKADSLIALYNSGDYIVNELDLLADILDYESDPDKTIKYSELLINKAAKDSSFIFLRNGFMQQGYALTVQGNNPAAIKAYFEAIKFARKSENQNGVGEIYISIADIYSKMGNALTAEDYYDRGIELLRQVDYPVALASALLNSGYHAFSMDKYDLALQYYQESGAIFKEADYLVGVAYNLGNVGMVYAAQGKGFLAEENMNEAIVMLEELQDYLAIAEYLVSISDIYLKKSDVQTALPYAQRSLDLATQNGLKDEISDANLKLSELYDKAGDKEVAFNYYKAHIVYRDSVKNIAAVQDMANTRTTFEVAQKQLEVDLQKKNQRIIVIATAITIFFIGLLAFGQYRRYKFVQATNKIIEQEKERSETLLMNILPEETAEELKLNGKVQAKKYESVTVLFTDFVGFTSYSKNLSPEVLVETVSYYFSKFDEIVEKYDLEKIKTIGDAYMCAGGLPFPTEDHAHKMIHAAFEIAAFVKEAKANATACEMNFDIRIGMSTGPVVAGVVGSKKFAYDIWGDTVNIASRMESNSEQGKINISENTYALVKDSFDCTYRGEIEVKNRGMLKMYFVDSAKE